MTKAFTDKEELRHDIYAKLSKMTAVEIASESRTIQSRIKEYLLKRAELESLAAMKEGREPQALRVAAYHAMNREADLHALITDPELQAYIDFYLPRSVRDEGDLQLHFAPWPKFTCERQPKDWVVSWYGAIEPPPDLASGSIDFDVILIPCLAVSPYGERLGHGKGYYDRFLKTQPLSTVLLGICLSPQAVDGHLPIEEHDHPLDGRVTAAGGIEASIKERGRVAL